MKVTMPDGGLHSFKPYPIQRNIIQTIHDNRFTIVKVTRQVGKTVSTISYILHLILFNPYKTVGILANKANNAREFLGRLKLAYENLPLWMQQGVVTWNKGDIELENGSKIIATATSETAARSHSYSLIFLDEFSFVRTTIQDEFYSAVYPTISAGKETKIVIVSTPNGFDLFYRLWVDAREGRNRFVPVEANWTSVPWRDEEWKKETIANTSEEQFRREHEGEFIGSSDTLISPSTLSRLTWITPDYTKDGLRVYEYPRYGRIYFIGADCAHGAELDYSAAVVIDITEMPYRVVATYYDNSVSALYYPHVLAQIGMKYNDAFILVEVNDVGMQVGNILHFDIEYENLMLVGSKGKQGQTLGAGFGAQSGATKLQYGVRMSTATKAIGCVNLKTLIEEQKLIIEDYALIAELSSFIAKGKSFEADEGHNDDLVMACVCFAWASTQKYFKELLDKDLRLSIFDRKIEQIESELTPFGVIEGGFHTEGPENSRFVDTDGTVWETVKREDPMLN